MGGGSGGVGMMPFFEERCSSRTKEECVGVGCGLVGEDIFDFGGEFCSGGAILFIYLFASYLYHKYKH